MLETHVHVNNDSYNKYCLIHNIYMLQIFGNVLYITLMKFCENHDIIKLSMSV